MPRFLILLATCLMPSVASSADEVSTLTDDDVQQLVKELRPDESKLWRSVPWQLSLIDAQAIAAERRQPLFIWAMDGHPLGCT